MTKQELDRTDILALARLARDRGAAEKSAALHGILAEAVAGVRRLFSAPGTADCPAC